MRTLAFWSFSNVGVFFSAYLENRVDDMLKEGERASLRNRQRNKRILDKERLDSNTLRLAYGGSGLKSKLVF